ncbi:hypothetical protein SAMN05216488_1777 [Microbacterium sp. LKL04]|uniref:hypothetical protein n=1 Tax=Microbacterium sp. LKL04 TaxID=912630 RepID=UPI000875CF80|nr:hypothetical protein [Microbacterium sp. LKL04]SCY43085.1 hypothetical protein SAMN05216488_1777 [Microbacterium sp. LKL04]
MNGTNRALNRTVVLIVGLVLLIGGGAAATAAAVPAVADVWTTTGKTVVDGLRAAGDATTIAGTTLSWAVIGATAVAIVIAGVLFASLTTLVSRRTRTVLRSSGSQTPLGRVTVTEGFAADAVKNSLARQDGVLSASVTAHAVKQEPVLHVSVTARQGADPRSLVDDVDRVMDGLAAVTGTETAAYISVHGGLRSRLATDAPRVS